MAWHKEISTRCQRLNHLRRSSKTHCSLHELGGAQASWTVLSFVWVPGAALVHLCIVMRALSTYAAVTGMLVDSEPLCWEQYCSTVVEHQNLRSSTSSDSSQHQNVSIQKADWQERQQFYGTCMAPKVRRSSYLYFREHLPSVKFPNTLGCHSVG